jgi:prevent-host-death family protein
MISAGIKEVKNNLSRLLAKVKAGEEILITERGRPVARIVKENKWDKSIRAAQSEGFETFPPADTTDREQENQSAAQPDHEKA